MHLDIISSGPYPLLGVYEYAHLWEAVYQGITPLGYYPLMVFIGVCPLTVNSAPGYNTLRLYLLMGVWVGPLAGKGDIYVSHPLMVSWGCARTLISSLGYTNRYTTPRLSYLAIFPYICPQVFCLSYGLINRPKYTTSSSGYTVACNPLEVLVLL